MIRWIEALDEVQGLDRAWVWRVELTGREAARALAACPPRPEDLADAAGLRQAEAGARRVLRRRLLRALAARALGLRPEGLRLSRDPDGAPVLEGHGGVHLTAAARGDWALLAVAPTPIGVDLELIGREPPPAEPGLDAWRAWTAREAYAKAARLPLDAALALPVLSQDSASTRLGVAGGAVEIRHEATPQLVCAAVTLLARRGAGERLRLKAGPEVRPGSSAGI